MSGILSLQLSFGGQERPAQLVPLAPTHEPLIEECMTIVDQFQSMDDCEG